MKLRMLIYLSIIFTAACNNDNSPQNKTPNGDFSFLMNRIENKPSQKLLDPIKVDDVVSTFGFRDLSFENYDKKYIKGTSQIREFDTYTHWTDESKILDKDTLYFNFEIQFNELGLITYLDNGKAKNEFKYDSNGNLLFRKLDSGENNKVTISRIFYDSLGNLMFYYQYQILEDSTYVLDCFKEYNYLKEEDFEGQDKIIVKIKGVEKWTSYHTSSTKKEFALSRQFVTEYRDAYSPLTASNSKFKVCYQYDKNDQNLLSKSYIDIKTSDTSHQMTYLYNTTGQLIEKKEILRNSSFQEYKTVSEYRLNTLIVSDYFYTDSPKKEDPDIGHLSTQVRKLDQYKNPISTKESLEDSIFREASNHTYEYDDKGAWIRKKSTYVGLKTKKWDYEVFEKLLSIREINYSPIQDSSKSTIEPDLKAESLLQEVLSKYGN